MKQETLTPHTESLEQFSLVIEAGIEEALAEVKEKFDVGHTPDEEIDSPDHLAFHNTEHTQDMIDRVMLILNTIRHVDPNVISRRELLLGKLAAAFHDIYQIYELVPVQDGDSQKILRKRFTGASESVSTVRVFDFMDKQNVIAGEEIFTDADKKFVSEGVNVTVPGFDPNLSTVVQPNLTENSSLVARALALADIGTAGIEGPESYLGEGDRLFREENVDIQTAMHGKMSTISATDKERFKTRMLAWCNFQPKFAEGRKKKLESETEGFPDTVKDAVRGLFSRFDDSIEAAKANAERRSKLTFDELALDMGY